MKLQAVTICINYADFLECITRNARHFDRWVIVTVPKDRETVNLCERMGFQYIFSRLLLPDGSDFHSSFNKARIINEGLDILDQEGWAVVLDSDVLLPRYFREQILEMPLESGFLYGMGGRKVCPDREMFDALKNCEPWDAFCQRNARVIGYFNLFSLDFQNNRYPKSREGAAEELHDDILFCNSFPYGRHRSLPMTSVHVGRSGVNWGERRAERYEGQEFRRVSRGDAREIFFSESKSQHNIAIVGYYPGMGVERWAHHFARVHLVDHHLIHHPSGDPLTEASRRALRAAWEKETEKLHNLERLGIHSESTLANIPNQSLDIIYLPGEISPEWSITALPLWLPKLRAGGAFCGDLYGICYWPETTFVISLLLGVPDEVLSEGFWWIRMSPALRNDRIASCSAIPRLSDVSGPPCKSEIGVVIVGLKSVPLQRLLVTVHSLRKYWSGPIDMYHFGDDEPSVRILCARYWVNWRSAAGFAPVAGQNGEKVPLETNLVSLYSKTLWILAGMLALGSLEEPLNEAFSTGERTVVAGTPDTTFLQVGITGASPIRVPAAAEFLGFRGDDLPLLWYEDDADLWSDAAWEKWSAMEAEMLSVGATQLRTPPNCSIVAVVDVRGLPDFERNWCVWKFRDDARVTVVLVGISEEQVWWPNDRRPTEMIKVNANADAVCVMRLAISSVKTERFVVLPPEAIPLPGAELFVANTWRRFAIVFHSEESGQNAGSDVEHVSVRHGMAMLDTQFAKQVCNRAAANPDSAMTINQFISIAIRSAPRLSTSVNASQWGWRFAEEACSESAATLTSKS